MSSILRPSPVVHALHGGMTYCGLAHSVARWPEGDRWAGLRDIEHVTCHQCLRAVATSTLPDEMAAATRLRKLRRNRGVPMFEPVPVPDPRQQGDGPQQVEMREWDSTVAHLIPGLDNEPLCGCPSGHWLKGTSFIEVTDCLSCAEVVWAENTAYYVAEHGLLLRERLSQLRRPWRTVILTLGSDGLGKRGAAMVGDDLIFNLERL